MSNQSNSSAKTEYYFLITPSTDFFTTVYSISLAAIILNGIEIKIIAQIIRKATDFEIILLNLAFADILSSLIFISVSATSHYAYVEKVNLQGAFHWLMAIAFFAVSTSVSFVIAIGIERFFAIKLPLQHRLWHTGKAKLIKCVCATWLLNVILTASAIILDYSLRGKGHQFKSETVSLIYAAVLTFSLTFILIIYSWVLHLMLKRSIISFNFDKKEVKINPKLIKKTLKKERSSIIVCTLVVTSFLACYTPVAVCFFQARATTAAVIMVKMSAVLNPIIYFFKGYLEKHYTKTNLSSNSQSAEAVVKTGKIANPIYQKDDTEEKDTAENIHNNGMKEPIEFQTDNQNAYENTSL